MSTADVLLDIEKAFDKTWRLGLLYKLSESKFFISLLKLISSFLSQGKSGVSGEGKMSMTRDTQAGVSQVSVLSSTLYSIYSETSIYCSWMYCFPGAIIQFL
jgi:hypothetical protein